MTLLQLNGARSPSDSLAEPTYEKHSLDLLFAATAGLHASRGR